ncbi:band 4.1-like protein 4 isoform X2 [Fundulus heteroclitus]|uniref:band 4.1-like protein 4 isoform X2 n=1 Tax=Fundulus heteroclitus TaxID=8078 RepID=UPI00165B8B2F|nr:band 4.1-like protein 4 isoform X2 [Fundulus heteroclitus]
MMMMCFRGNRDEFYGEVLLLDGRKLTLTSEQGITVSVHLVVLAVKAAQLQPSAPQRSSKAAAIFEQVFAHLNLVQVQFFGLRFCDCNQRSFWLDPTKTVQQHRQLIGPPYIFYFGVKFYVEDPTKLKEETSRGLFYLQVRQDIRRGVLPCPTHLRPHLLALMQQVDRGDHSEDETSEDEQEVQLIWKTLSGVSRLHAQNHFLLLCSSLQMYGVTLFAACGENRTEYFLGPTPVAVVIFKNKVLVGKYFWQRITKLHFKGETFELQVSCRNGSEASFFFHTYDRCDCKRLWRCCVEHHTFFRMSGGNAPTQRLRLSSVTRSSSLSLPRLKGNKQKSRAFNPKTITDDCLKTTQCTNHNAGVNSEPITRKMAPAAVQRSEDGPKGDHLKPNAPWENSHYIMTSNQDLYITGLFNPKFPPNTREEQGGPQRRSRSLDGDRPIRRQRRSSGSDCERTSNGERRSRRWSPDAQIRKRILKQLVEPEGLMDRQTEEIPYKEVRVSEQPMRRRRSPRGRRRLRSASASELQSVMSSTGGTLEVQIWSCLPSSLYFSSKVEMVPPLSVTMATVSSCPAEGTPAGP